MRERLTEKTFGGLTASYTDAELAFMAQLMKGLPETKNEIILIHEAKALLDAVMIEEEVPRGEVFDPTLAALGAESGMSQAAGAKPVQGWRARADAWLLTKVGQEIQADDLIRDIGLPHPESEPATNNVIGSFFNAAAKRKEITWTGRMAKSERVVRKGNLQRVWFVNGGPSS